MERYYQEEIECASREQIKAIQDEKLVKQVKHVWDNVPYYRKKMEEKGVTPEDIRSVDDLHKLPFLSKAEAAGPRWTVGASSIPWRSKDRMSMRSSCPALFKAAFCMTSHSCRQISQLPRSFQPSQLTQRRLYFPLAVWMRSPFSSRTNSVRVFGFHSPCSFRDRMVKST